MYSSHRGEVTRASACTWIDGRSWLCFVFAILFLSGCGRPERVQANSGPDGQPTVLRLGYTPSEETVADREEAQSQLAAYLQRATGIPVVLVRTASYGPAIEAMAGGEIDIMSLGPFAYVIAAEQGAAEAIAVTGRPSTGPRTYQSVLITHQRTGLTHLDAVAMNAKRLRFNFTDPASNSGHLVPEARLAALGIAPARDFASTEFTLSHSVSIFNVAFGHADLAGVSASVLDRLMAKKRVPAEDLVVLWRSERLPLGPVAVRPSLPPALKQTIQQALVQLSIREPETSRKVMLQYPDSDLVYLPCNDTLYNGLRAVAARVQAGSDTR